MAARVGGHDSDILPRPPRLARPTTATHLRRDPVGSAPNDDRVVWTQWRSRVRRTRRSTRRRHARTPEIGDCASLAGTSDCSRPLMEGITAIVGSALGRYVFGWLDIRAADLRFMHLDTARLAAVVVIGLSVFGLVRRASTRSAARRRLALPAVMPTMRRSYWSLVRHGASMPLLVGLGFLLVAVADPYTGLTRREVSYPGRRIAMLIDASSSMMTPFSAATLAGKGMAFSTNVAAAEYFMRLRMKGKYRDLIATGRIRRRSVRNHSVHQRLRQHPPQCRR